MINKKMGRSNVLFVKIIAIKKNIYVNACNCLTIENDYRHPLFTLVQLTL